jgi:hypothetical protein
MLGNNKKNIGFDSNLFTNKTDAPVFNPAAISSNFTARVIANGGSLTVTQQNAILALVTNLVNNNLWSKMKIIYPFVGGTAASCAVNLVSSNYLATFSSGWTFTATGAKPTGANTFWIANGFSPFVQLNSFDTSFSYYSRTNNTRRGFELGIVENVITVANLVSLSVYDNFTPPASAFNDLNNFTTGRISTNTVGTQTLGLYMGTRTSQTSQKLFRNGNLFGLENTQTMTANLPNATLYFGTLYFNDSVNYISTDRQCAFAHAGSSMTSGEALTFYNNVQTFQTSLSRQV